MAAVPISQAGRAYITKAPPWSKSAFKLGRLGFEPGKVPDHLKNYLFKKGGIPAACAAETKNLEGRASRVIAMNACVSAKIKGAGGRAAR